MCKVLLDAISQNGIAAVLGFGLSWVIEWYPNWDMLPARVKRLALLLACWLIGVVLVVVNWRLCGEPMSIEAFWNALAAGFAAFTASQAAHIRKLE
jgi:acyl-CoA synthetase (AMP-forming)/AMP-acid ligase II